jgi:hypothetical protein
LWEDRPVNKDVQHLISALRKDGWRVTIARTHYKAYPPDLTQQIVTFSATPRGSRWRKDVLAQLRKSGYRPGRATD